VSPRTLPLASPALPQPRPKQISEPPPTTPQTPPGCTHSGGAPAPTAHMSLLYGYHQTTSRWIPEPTKLQNRHLFLLRWPQPLPTLNPDGPPYWAGLYGPRGKSATLHMKLTLSPKFITLVCSLHLHHGVGSHSSMSISASASSSPMPSSA